MTGIDGLDTRSVRFDRTRMRTSTVVRHSVLTAVEETRRDHVIVFFNMYTVQLYTECNVHVQ